MSEKWMWNGARGGSTTSAASSASRNGSAAVYAPSLVACMCAKSSTGRTQPVRREISITSSRLGGAGPPPPPPPPQRRGAGRPHPRDADGAGAPLPLEPLAQLAELLDDRVDRRLARAFEQEAGVEDDELG